MKLLVVTQVVDADDAVLGFFHRWLQEFALHAAHIEAVTLFEGRHALPATVRVHSLGKEKKAQPGLIYGLRFLAKAWSLRKEYDAVFVHMNQEYVLLAGLMWWCLGKRVYLWRNHYAGSWLTNLAAAFCTKVFCTSRQSYTARFSKTVLMPVGVDAAACMHESTGRVPNSILWLARISRSKRLEMFLDALALLQGVSFSATVVGSPLPKDQRYYDALVARTNKEAVRFLPAVPHNETPALFHSHEFFVNTSRSGMFDKTLFEAAACGALPLAISDDWRTLVGDERLSFEDAHMLAKRLETLLTSEEAERAALVARLRTDVVAPNGIDVLTAQLFAQMS